MKTKNVFYFIISMRTASSITEKKNGRILWLLFGNEINPTEGDITVPTAHVQIMFPLKDKKRRVFEDIFFWDTDE